ncbi:MAG: restriction endonuclease subunit S [Porcincola intestinalis]|uniref:restriction endonuclease subunit S n=1 Tax=Porcincola intestinalis TaxID=2606632 RepID=UPI002A90DFE2|nr:restriction endonuclease subunit S [Porcincola intestinalis]MDY5332537.1 restriction endonuclease subunit S [Porcincola intestinalis]
MAVPKLRFPEFTDDWEQRKLGDIVERVTRKNTNLESDLPLTISAQYGLIDQNEFFDKRVASKDVSGYYLVNNGEFAYNKSTSNDAPWGAVKRLDRYEKGVVSTLYIVFGIRDSHQTDSDFLATYYDTNRWYSGVQAVAAEGARNHGLLNIAASDFFDTTLMLPASIEEQQRIGAFFKSLDNAITLHQRKLEDLRILKKSMLQKMFPSEGNSVPEVRFPEFTAAWEQRKLSQIYSTIRNAFVGTATPYYVDDGHFYLESNNVKDGQINHNTEVFINDEFYKKQKGKWLHTGDLVMVQSGHVGHTAVIPPELDNTAAHALIMFQHPKQEIEPYFLNYELQTLSAKKKIADITTGNTIKHILASEMQEFVMDLPSILEQRRIAAFFRQIDNTITLHQRKCDDLQKLKKALLQQMFC